MMQTAGTDGPLARKLRLIHERMAGVSDREVESALAAATTEGTRGATVAKTWVINSMERPARNALTQTA
jgi:hypothetical protein